MGELLLSRPGDKVLHREPGYMIVEDADGRQFQFWWNPDDNSDKVSHEPPPKPPRYTVVEEVAAEAIREARGGRMNDSNEPIEPQPIPPGWEPLGFTSLE